MRWSQRLFRRVLVSVLPLGLLGFVALVVIPNLYAATQRSHQKRTMADLRSMATALEAWGTDHGPYPDLVRIESARPLLEPTYMRRLPQEDGWGNRYALRAGEHAYILASSGSDGRFNVDYVAVATLWKSQAIESFTQDVIYANGSFIQYPRGT